MAQQSSVAYNTSTYNTTLWKEGKVEDNIPKLHTDQFYNNLQQTAPLPNKGAKLCRREGAPIT